MSLAGLTQCTGSSKLRTLDQDSGSRSIAARHKAIVLRLQTIADKGLGSERPLQAGPSAAQSGLVVFTCLAVDILPRASAEVCTGQTSAADTAYSEGIRAVILVAMEVAAAIRMVITARSEGLGLECRTISACHRYLYRLDGNGTAGRATGGGYGAYL